MQVLVAVHAVKMTIPTQGSRMSFVHQARLAHSLRTARGGGRKGRTRQHGRGRKRAKGRERAREAQGQGGARAGTSGASARRAQATRARNLEWPYVAGRACHESRRWRSPGSSPGKTPHFLPDFPSARSAALQSINHLVRDWLTWSSATCAHSDARACSSRHG